MTRGKFLASLLAIIPGVKIAGEFLPESKKDSFNDNKPFYISEDMKLKYSIGADTASDNDTQVSITVSSTPDGKFFIIDPETGEYVREGQFLTQHVDK